MIDYIKDASKIYVIKIGGSILESDYLLDSFATQINCIRTSGISVVVVHGGGSYINHMLKRLDIEPRFRDGLRITDAQTMEVVEMVLSGKNNKRIVTELQLKKLNAVGIGGKTTMLCFVKNKSQLGRN